MQNKLFAHKIHSLFIEATSDNRTTYVWVGLGFAIFGLLS